MTNNNYSYLTFCSIIVMLVVTTACISFVSPPIQKSSNISSVSGNKIQPSKIIAISGSYTHNLALRENGTVTAWSEDKWGKRACLFGACDVPGNLTNVTAIAAGGGYSVALTDDGTVRVWGCGDYYQESYQYRDDCPCRLPANLTDVKAISAGSLHALALRKDGTVVAWGKNSSGRCNVPPDMKNVTAISAGGTMSMALRKDGWVVVWGNYEGCVPEGKYQGIAGGYREGLLVTTDGMVRVFRHTMDVYPPVYHPDLANVTAISYGPGGAIALLDNHTAVYWYLSDSHWNVTDIPNITAISWNLGLRDDGTVVFWSM